MRSALLHAACWLIHAVTRKPTVLMVRVEHSPWKGEPVRYRWILRVGKREWKRLAS